MWQALVSALAPALQATLPSTPRQVHSPHVEMGCLTEGHLSQVRLFSQCLPLLMLPLPLEK